MGRKGEKADIARVRFGASHGVDRIGRACDRGCRRHLTAQASGAAARTAALFQEINPVQVLTLGDAQYGNGT
jgi:hypothetical protein